MTPRPHAFRRLLLGLRGVTSTLGDPPRTTRSQQIEQNILIFGQHHSITARPEIINISTTPSRSRLKIKLQLSHASSNKVMTFLNCSDRKKSLE